MTVQGFIAFGTRVLFSTAKRRLSDRAHVEPARGTPAQNTKYCTKEESRKPGTEPFVVGTEPPPHAPGKRSDLLR